MNRFRIALLLNACWVGAALAQPLPDPHPPKDPFFVEAADCTAAFKARVLAHKGQARSEARDQAILRDTERGFVFIGVAYKKGLRNPEADQMLEAAEKRRQKLDPASQDKQLVACTARAQQLMDDVSWLERYFVRNRARSQVDKWLEKEQRQASAPAS